MGDVTIRREHNRIIFGEGGDRWSVADPENPALEERRQRMTAESDFLPRDIISTYLYLVFDCPTTTLAQQKIAAIRRAVRAVPSPYPEGDE